MEETSTIKLDPKTKEQLEYAGKCIKIRKKEPDAFYTQQYIIKRLILEYLDKIGVQKMPPDLNESNVESMEKYLQRKRIDINLKQPTKDDLKALSKALLKRKMVDRKLNYQDVVVLLLNKYLELYPELVNDLLEFRYIKQNLGTRELQDKIERERLDKLI